MPFMRRMRRSIAANSVARKALRPGTAPNSFSFDKISEADADADAPVVAAEPDGAAAGAHRTRDTHAGDGEEHDDTVGDWDDSG